VGGPQTNSAELISAAGAGDGARVASLIAAGADVNAAHDGGDTALTRAASKGHGPIVKALVEAGADTSAEREDGFDALALAVLFGYTEVVRVLLEGGADPASKGRLGTTAEKWARFNGFDEIVKLLEDARREASPDSDASKTNGVESDTQLFFPPEGNFNAVVPLSEVGKPLDKTRRSDGHEKARRADEQEEVTLVPARAAHAPRSRVGRPSWLVLAAVLTLSVAAGLTAGTYLIKSRQRIELQTAAPLSVERTAGVAEAPEAPEVNAARPAQVSSESRPATSESQPATSSSSDVDHDSSSEPGRVADSAAPDAKKRGAASSDGETGGASSTLGRGRGTDEPSPRDARAGEPSPRILLIEQTQGRAPRRPQTPNAADPPAQRDTIPNRRARNTEGRPHALSAPERERKPPVSTPPAYTNSKRVIQWP
jgi:Ankyrin repeats (3 copies)